MGQRLVITAQFKNQNVAKIYYHWSGFSTTAIREAQRLIDYINIRQYTNVRDLQLKLIRYCESNGGGIDFGADMEEYKYIQFLFPDESFKKVDISRNKGIIAISDTGMDEIQSWSEGDLIIDFDKNYVYNSVFGAIGTSIDEINIAYGYDDDKECEFTLDCVSEIDFNPSVFHFDEITKMLDVLHSRDFSVLYSSASGDYYTLIE